MNYFIKQLKSIDFKGKLFYTLMTVILLSSCVISILTNGQAVSNILFERGREFFFSDFFGMIKASASDSLPYENGVIYPPLAVLFFKILSMLFSNDLSSYDMRATSLGMIIIVSYYILTTIAIALCIFKYKNGHKTEKAIFLTLAVTSLPMIFLIERGNIVNLALIFIFIYIYGYDSESKIVRQLSYIALAIATALKIYPVIFGLLLLRKKNNWKNILSCIIWGALIFFVPFVFVGGFESFVKMVKNILLTSAVFFEKGLGYKVNISIMFKAISQILGHYRIFDTLANVVIMFVTISGILLLLFGKFNAKWKVVAVGTLIIIIIPGFSFVYNVLYMLIPLMLFLDEKKKNKLDIIYCLLFVLQFAFFIASEKSVIPNVAENELKLNITTVIEAFSLFAMTGLLWIEGFITSLIEYKDTKILKKIPANIIIIATLVITVAISGVYSYISTPSKSGFAITSVSVFSPSSKKDEKIINEYKNYANTNLKDSKVLAFPRIDMLDYDGKMSYFDKSYYDNSIHKINNVKKFKPEYIVLYNVYSDDIKNCAKSISDSELDKYMEMNQDIKKYCYSFGYEKIQTYTVNDVGQICIWQKTDKDKNTSWYNSGDGSIESPFTITTASELVAFSDYVNTGHSMKDTVVQLGCDIDMSSYDNFSPIANEKGTVAYKGTFDGNGYSIKNLTMNATKKYNLDEYKNSALFGLFSGTIMNLTIENSSFTGTKVASFVRLSQSSKSTIINCLSINNTFDGDYVGEIANSYKGSIISSVSIDSTYNKKATSFGIVGINNNRLLLDSVYTNNKNSIGYNAYVNTKLLPSNEILTSLNNPASSIEKHAERLCKWSSNGSKLTLAK